MKDGQSTSTAKQADPRAALSESHWHAAGGAQAAQNSHDIDAGLEAPPEGEPDRLRCRETPGTAPAWMECGGLFNNM
jgi:hypothetical protein